MTAAGALPQGRYRTNPRTDELPMAFTASEFLRGVILTYVSFLGATAAVSVFWFVVGAVVALTYAAPIALLTTIVVGAPTSLALGMLLRRERRTWVHLAAHAGSGTVAGFAGITFFLCLTEGIWTWTAPHLPDYGDIATFPWLVIYPLLTPLCAMWGWRLTSRRALSAP